MNILELPERNIRLEIPSHWDEMDSEQRQYCLKQAVMCTSGIISLDEAKVRCFYHLAEIKRNVRAVAVERVMSKEMYDEKNSKVVLLAEQLCGFMFKKNEEGKTEICYETIYNLSLIHISEPTRPY